MGLLRIYYYGISRAIAASLIPLIITALVMIHCAGKTFLIVKIEKARDVSARRLNENENSCDGDCAAVLRWWLSSVTSRWLGWRKKKEYNT